MSVKMLDFKYHTNPETGCLCRYVRSDTERFVLHNHNYYELFMVLKGDVLHIVNGTEQLLSEGQLLFIRDFDIHNYQSANGEYFEFINLAFTKENLDALFYYLGDGYPTNELLKAPLPPIVSLSERNKEKIFYNFTEIGLQSDKTHTKMKLRTILFNVFSEYFYNYSSKTTDIPLWLEMTYEKMKKPENFIKGIDRMYEISGKSREHLCRMLKQHYNTTPTTLINELRLEYCENILLSSNLCITDICFECGFENISWFYKAFEKKHGMTPKEYRKKYERNFKS